MAQRVYRGIALLFNDRGTRGGEWSAARPGRTLPPGKTRYSFYRRLGGPQDRSGRAENLVPTGIRSRTVQPLAQSLYRLIYRAHHNSFKLHIKLHFISHSFLQFSFNISQFCPFFLVSCFFCTSVAISYFY